MTTKNLTTQSIITKLDDYLDKTIGYIPNDKLYKQLKEEIREELGK